MSHDTRNNFTLDEPLIKARSKPDRVIIKALHPSIKSQKPQHLAIITAMLARLNHNDQATGAAPLSYPRAES